MNEPEYVFDKLKGWVPYTELKEIEFENAHGRFRIVNREPVPGERYGVFSRHDHKYVKDGKILIEVWADHIKTCNRQAGDFNQYTDIRYFEPHRDNYLVCTLMVL